MIRCVFVCLFIHVTHAQQQCYWPDGSLVDSSTDGFLNCYSDRDSQCCANGEVCLSNGLCFGPGIGQVGQFQLIHNRQQLPQHLLTQASSIEAPAQSKTGVIPRLVQPNGVTTVCSEFHTYGFFLLSSLESYLTNNITLGSIINNGSKTANIWKCPSSGQYMWCGDQATVGYCGSFANTSGVQFALPIEYYNGGSVLGCPPVTSAQRDTLTVTHSADSVNITTSVESPTMTTSSLSTSFPPSTSAVVSVTPSVSFSSSQAAILKASATYLASSSTIQGTSTGSVSLPEHSQSPPQNSNTATAIGAGIGVPLSAAVIGLLGLIFWNKSKKSENVQRDELDMRQKLCNLRRSMMTVGRERELPDNQRPWEADADAGKAELAVYVT